MPPIAPMPPVPMPPVPPPVHPLVSNVQLLEHRKVPMGIAPIVMLSQVSPSRLLPSHISPVSIDPFGQSLVPPPVPPLPPVDVAPEEPPVPLLVLLLLLQPANAKLETTSAPPTYRKILLLFMASIFSFWPWVAPGGRS